AGTETSEARPSAGVRTEPPAILPAKAAALHHELPSLRREPIAILEPVNQELLEWKRIRRPVVPNGCERNASAAGRTGIENERPVGRPDGIGGHRIDEQDRWTSIRRH